VISRNVGVARISTGAKHSCGGGRGSELLDSAFVVGSEDGGPRCIPLPSFPSITCPCMFAPASVLVVFSSQHVYLLTGVKALPKQDLTQIKHVLVPV